MGMLEYRADHSQDYVYYAVTGVDLHCLCLK